MLLFLLLLLLLLLLLMMMMMPSTTMATTPTTTHCAGEINGNHPREPYCALISPAAPLLLLTQDEVHSPTIVSRPSSLLSALLFYAPFQLLAAA